jgi:molybdenum cofactor synthesis domain-containing protein
MRPFTSVIPFDEAVRLVMGAAVPIERAETVAIADADGRVLARDVVAPDDVPAFDRAAMDGYAVVAADTSGAAADTPRSLSCVGRLFTGETTTRPVGRGECIEIATGAPMPPGADAVVMVEDTVRSATHVAIRAGVTAGQNIGRRGADVRRGSIVVPAGRVLGPSQIGAVAATGAAQVDVFAKPRVAVCSTGNEVIEPGRGLGPGQVHDVNRFTVSAVVARHGGVPVPGTAIGDTLPALSAALDRALESDVVILSGGSSVGDRDLILDVLRARGEVLFHGVAVKPGKPTGFALVGHTPVFALPGYPTSCLSNALILVAPFLRRVARLPPSEPRMIALPLSRRIMSAPGRHQFYTVRIVDGQAVPAFKASGDITSMAHADGYIEIPSEADTVEEGTMVQVALF